MLTLVLENDFLSDLNSVTAIVAPYLPLVGVLAGGLLIGAFNIWNRRRNAEETRAPDVNELWKQQSYQAHELDAEYRLRRRLQNFSDELLRVFRNYVTRVQTGGPSKLTDHERVFYNAETPTAEIKTNPPE